MYKIKPLKWDVVDHNYSDMYEIHKSITPICMFTIERWVTGDWVYRYCFDECYDDGEATCKDLQDGKDICEKIWEERLKKCLVEI